MKSQILTAVMAVLSSAAFAQKPADAVAVEKEVRQLEEQLRAAAVKRDTAAFDRLLADDYTSTNLNGLTRSKAEVIADAKSGAAKTESLTLDNVKVRVYGDAAVLTADRTVKSTLRGQDTSGRLREIRVFVKRNGRWQAVAMQTTPIR
jgi:uncharacterized protein (TIGR02246 family)